MSQLKLIKISGTGEQLPDDATEWDAVLLADHGLIFSATNVAEDVPHAKCLAACKALTLLGQNDWDLPSIEELSLLVDRTCYEPAINTDYFRDIRNDWYWTTTPCAWSSASAWGVYFGNGNVGNSRRDSGGFALAVRRAGQ